VRLVLEDIELSVVLGMLPAERISPRLAFVSVECEGEPSPGGLLADYRDVVAAVAALEGSAFGPVEDLATAVLEKVRQLRPDASWTVSVSKPLPGLPLRLRRASVTVRG
jgi:dihydroneopterin aldolase